MATIEYNISASYIGSGLGNSSFVVYADECGTGPVVGSFSKAQLLSGVTIDVETTVQSIFLVPILDDPLANSCVLGCGNAWSELVLSEFVPSPTPSVTATPSATIAATPSVTPTITPTPSTSQPGLYTTFALPQILTKPVSDRLQIAITGTSWLRASVAGAIASYAANGTYVPQSSDQNGNNAVALDRDFTIYTEGEVSIVSVNQDYDSQVFWFDDPDPAEETAYVMLDNISLPLSIPNAPTNATSLKYRDQ